MSAKRIRKFENTESNRSYYADDDFLLWWLILQMRRSLYKARAKELTKYRLTPEKTAALFIIKVIGYRATAAEISRYLLREPHSVVGLLNRMERQGLVERFNDLERKNLVRVALTEKGEKAYSQSAKRKSIRRIFSCLSVEERQQLAELLERLRNKALEDLGEIKPPKLPTV